MSESLNTGLTTLADLPSLVPQNVQELTAAEVKSIVDVKTFLPRLQLFGASADAVKKRKIQMAHYGLVRGKDDPIIDLGERPIIMPFTYRWKAMRKLPDGSYLTYYDLRSQVFQDVKKDTQVPESGHMVGSEFLVFIPDQEQFNYATFYLCSATALQIHDELKAMLNRPIELYSELIENKKKQTWYGPTVTVASGMSKMPNPAEMMEKAHDFNNAKDSVIEVAKPAEPTEGGEQRQR